MNRRFKKATPRRYVLTGLLALAVAAAPVAVAQRPLSNGVNANSENGPSFEVASIKPSRPDSNDLDWDDLPGRVSIRGYNLRQLIRVAYGLKSDEQVLGGPKLVDGERFDIVAKADDAETAKMQKMSGADWVKERNRMLQSLLADRFRLRVTAGERSMGVYSLVIAKSGVKFKASAPGEQRHDLSGHNNHLTATGVLMSQFADYLTRLSEISDRVVVDRTGLTGDYDFTLEWSRDRRDGTSQGSQYPGLFTALEEQLGLKLDPEKAPVEVVIIDSAMEPARD
jgi:uncharacterized protein (TIGR03435 family)